MWTNVFKIGGLNQISWFQFLPLDPEGTPLPDKSLRTDERDTSTVQVLSSHVQLQKGGFLSTWTNSFVGPWDPSQGLHNPDKKIKLWLFLPGRHSSVIETAQAAISRLRVAASGIWIAPGDSEEIAVALSQALRNKLERSLMGLSYVRFGDVFTRCNPSSRGEELFRKGQPAIEFVFAASEEALFVHVIISSKLVRAISAGDIKRLSKLSSDSSVGRLPVIVSPHGMRGRLTGCSPSDLVKHVYVGSDMLRSSSGSAGIPRQNCYIEVAVGCNISESGTGKKLSLSLNKHIPNNQTSYSPSIGGGVQRGSADETSVLEKTFIHPMEAILVPILQSSYARSSLKRLWLQNWMGPSFPSSTIFMDCIADEIESMDALWMDSSHIWFQRGENSSGNSKNSSISSVSSGSTDSDHKNGTSTSDLEADADSLTCSQSGLSSISQMDTNGPKQGAKRSRSGMQDSFDQMGARVNASGQDAYNSSAITGLGNDQIGSHWDWDDDDRGVVMDIEVLLSEFGDFGDFFVNDVLPFGEPPGNTVSEAMVFSGADCEDLGGNSAAGVIGVSDQMLLPGAFPTFESFGHLPTGTEECPSTLQENSKSTLSSGPVSCVQAAPSTEYDHVLKAEAAITFAAEYGAVETPPSEVSSTIFRSPYRPESKMTQTISSSGNSFTYGATPPSSPCLHVSNEKPGISIDSRTCSVKDVGNVHKMKLYTHVGSCKDPVGRKPVVYNDTTASCEAGANSLYSGLNSAAALKSFQRSSEVNFGAEHLLLSSKTVTASEIECHLFQASMCRARHTLLSSINSASDVLNRTTGSTLLSHMPSDPSSMTDDLSTKYEMKRKESIPVRIAGDIDDGIMEGTLNAPVGVWRSVGLPKGSKPTSAPPTDVFTSSNNSFAEGNIMCYGKRHPLQDFLDGMALLVQQAAAFVDVALDAECGDGPYGWLALQEQQRRAFCCGPHMVHAGCGGLLASSHSLDIAGVELADPLSADVHASSVTSLLHCDVKAALKSAFGSLDGPLPVTDWCKGWCQSGDGGAMSDGFSSESSLSECRDSSSNVMGSVGDPVSPLQSSASASSSCRDGSKGDDTCHRRSKQELFTPESESHLGLRRRPRIFVVPYPAILVGYQDDWLKVSASSLHLWEKAPFEPYAFPKHMTYYVVCPNIDPLTSAAADFFQQLGTVYETCKLGTHSPQILENELGTSSGKLSSSGFILLDCPQSMKIEDSNASLVGSISDYFLSLSNGWDMTSFLKSLTKVLKALKLGSLPCTNAKEGNSSPYTVIYIVCPFPDQTAILQTVVESCVTVGSVIFSADSDRRSTLHSQVGKALSCSAGIDEASVSNILRLSGFSIPKLVLQIVTVDTIFRVTSPTLSELVILKDIAFTVYNKARRTSHGSSNDLVHSSSLPGRSHSVAIQMANPNSGMWKECVTSRISAPSVPRENEMDTGLQAGGWNSTWQTSKSGGLGCDGNRVGDLFLQEDMHYAFEPLFILSEPGSLQHALESSKQVSDDCSTGGFHQNSTSTDTVTGSQLEGSESESFGLGHRKSLPSLHCCYGWTEDWRWMVCVWTDSRGELLDSHIFPFGGVSSRQDTKGIQSLFVQVLQRGCQILQASTASDNGAARPRDFVITRVGSFYELEYQEWKNALYSTGGSELKRWPVQLRRAAPDGLSISGNKASLQQQEMERSLPTSPSPLYSPHAKSSGFTRGAMGQPSVRKQLLGGPQVDSSMGLLQWVQSISFVSVSVDHSLHLVLPEETAPGGTQGSYSMGPSTYLEGYTPVKSVGSTPSSYIFIPSPSMRFLTPTTLQLPSCLTSESPPLAHLLHSRGTAIPVSTAFVVSKSVPSLQRNGGRNFKEWPSVLSVSLVDYYGGYGTGHDKPAKGISGPTWRGPVSDSREFEVGETHPVLESIAAELHALSWMTVSPAYLDRRTALPFHCDTVLRLRRLLHFADKHLSHQPEKLPG